MTTKPFEVQGDTIILDGVEIQVTGGSINIDGVPVSAGSVDWDNVTNQPFIPSDVSDLTDETNLLTGGTGLGSRVTTDATALSLADGTVTDLNLDGYAGYILYKIQTSHAAWVRVYTDNTSRLNDTERSPEQDPLPGSGVIAEVITTGAETVLITPGTIGFNDESPVTTNIPIAVTNLSGGTEDVTVTLTILQIES